MIFDDHEMIDDWNTSAAWRAKVSQESWWTERILGGLASYRIYQQLGNLSPDELTAETKSWLTRRRAAHRARKPGTPDGPKNQVGDFEEYTRLYVESWGDPQVRWLLSTIPSSMIFDDHEMIDDWNTSAAWREKVTREGWWTERISAGMVSYWVYQHLGNLSPQELAENKTWQAIQDLSGAAGSAVVDAEPVLRQMAQLADTEPTSIRWSYVRHWGDARMIMIDSRAGRVLEETSRRMVDDAEFEWIEAATRRSVEEGVEHLILGTSLPWLLPHAIHNLERWNETLNVRHLGRRRGRLAEAIRQAADLEHWAAFGDSFERLAAALTDVARGTHGRAPASALVLSGDVHHAYAAEVVRPTGLTARVHQLPRSPLMPMPHPVPVVP